MSTPQATQQATPTSTSRLSHMTKSVNIHEAKTHLSRLLEEAQGGEEIIICKAGVPVARLVPVGAERRPSGVLKGRLTDLPLDHPAFAPLGDDELKEWGW